MRLTPKTIVTALMIAFVIAVLAVAAPFVVYLIYAMICKGPDCFR
jgi:hypothetical protein